MHAKIMSVCHVCHIL